ncbi:hypothetical protein CRG98_031280 [Punica granatum]|uniref:At2g24240-like C-terminal beta-propeller domain-containing protein n=1 Tax=Punica granatum TaxID=22663 RepID=A0A2I0IWD8_PUNGR|nr:hypothetical protein CRG98_031280 [Punica granatum]
MQQRCSDINCLLRVNKRDHSMKVVLAVFKIMNVMDSLMNVGFLDYRNIPKEQPWPIGWASSENTVAADHDHPDAIHHHKGQLFAHTRNNGSVFSSGGGVEDLVLTSKVRASDCKGPICDMSIGGDHLFFLYTNPDVVKLMVKLENVQILVGRALLYVVLTQAASLSQRINGKELENKCFWSFDISVTHLPLPICVSFFLSLHPIADLC